MRVAHVTHGWRARGAMWRTIVRHLLLHIGVILGACSGLCWAGWVRARYEPGRAAVTRAGGGRAGDGGAGDGGDAARWLSMAQRALPAAAAALALAAHLCTAAAAATRAQRNTTLRRTMLLLLVVLVCSGLVVAALLGALWARAAAAAHGQLPAAAAAADLLDVLRLLLRVCAKHHLLPDDIDLIIEETIEEFYEWIYAVCAIAGLTWTLLVLAASAAVALLCTGNSKAAASGLVTPPPPSSEADIPSDAYSHNIQYYEEKPLWEIKSSLQEEKAPPPA